MCSSRLFSKAGLEGQGVRAVPERERPGARAMPSRAPVQVQAAWGEDLFGAEEPHSEGEAAPVEQAAAGAAEGAQPEAFPDSIDGCRLVQDQHGGYVRLLMTCPATHTAHCHRLPCRKYRNVGPSQTAQCGRGLLLA